MRDYTGTPVKDLSTGGYLGRITGGSVETGRWAVQAPDGAVTEHSGCDIIEVEEADVPASAAPEEES